MFTKMRRNRLAICVQSILMFCLGACVVEVADSEEDVTGLGMSEQPLASTIDFENYPLGMVGAPWFTFQTGASSAKVVSAPDHGKALLVDGSTAEGAFLSSGISFQPSISSDLSIRFQVKPETGSTPAFLLSGSGRGYQGNQLRLTRTLGGETLYGGFANVPCGTLPSKVWSTVTLTVHAQLHTFDVSINGVSTCQGVAITRFKAPFVGFSVLDASNLGWGGKTYWDDFSWF